MRRHGLRQSLTEAGVRQAKVLGTMGHRHLLAQAVLALTQRAAASSDRGHMLTDIEVKALDEGGIDLPTMCRQDLVHRLQGAAYDAVAPPDQTPLAHGFDHWRIQQWRQWPPAWRGHRACGLAALGVHPVPIVRQQGCQVLPKAIGEQQRRAGGGQPLRDVVDKALGQRQRASPNVHRQQQLALGVHRGPDPLGRAIQTLDGRGLTDLPVLDRAEQRQQLIELHLLDPYVVQEGLGEGSQLLRCLDEPLQHGLGIHLEHPGSAAEA